MGYKVIISSWKWGLLSDETEELVGRPMARAVREQAKRDVKAGKWWRIFVLPWMILAFIRQRIVYLRWRKGKSTMRKFFELFYRVILARERAAPIWEKLAASAEEAVNRLDHEMIEILKEVRADGKSVALLSVGLDFYINHALKAAGLTDTFDPVVANSLHETDGQISGISLDVYAQKPKYIREQFIDRMGVSAEEIIYFGGSEQDHGVAEMLPPGNFIVSRHVPDEFKEQFVSKYQAFAPSSAEELRDYLQQR